MVAVGEIGRQLTLSQLNECWDLQFSRKRMHFVDVLPSEIELMSRDVMNDSIQGRAINRRADAIWLLEVNVRISREKITILKEKFRTNLDFLLFQDEEVNPGHQQIH